jgi:diadenosine tetraphosphate (Ap4A) HIT family hydrolase
LPGKASQGHFLVTRYRHFSRYFDINYVELATFQVSMARGKEIVDEKYHQDGYNTVINIDSCAGQSIHDLHIQLIPYYEGGVGIVRGVIPHKKRYSFCLD